MDKYQLIDSMIVQIDALVDMHGAQKCRTVLDVISKLTALKKGIQDDETTYEERIKALEAGMRSDE